MNSTSPFFEQFDAIYQPFAAKYGIGLRFSGNERTILLAAILVVAIAAALLVLWMVLMPAQRKVVRKRRVRRIRRKVVAAEAPTSESQPESEAAEALAEDKPKPKRVSPAGWRVIAALLWATVILVAFAVTYVATGTNSYCGLSCHANDSHVALATKNQHADCIDCHESNPVSGMVARVNMAFAQSTGLRFASKAPVDSGLCLRCHTTIATTSVKTRTGLIVSHKEILAAGRTCSDCHVDEGHKKRSAATVAGMSACMTCHDGAAAPRTCVTCHNGGSPLSISGAAAKTHSAYDYGPAIRVANRDCARCHGAETKCKACHNGLVLPHPRAFVDGGHARMAAFEGRQRCLKCHTMKWCGNDRCHHSFSAHNATAWRTGHQTGTSANCGGCHMSWSRRGSFCKVCH
jgi:nitrate/TMAO reductase-like tetraheme cytochrome c subunit